MYPAEIKLINSLDQNSGDWASLIVREARSWLGTPYMHWGREKGKHVDCIGLIIGVAQELGLGEYHKKNYAKAPDPVKMGKELISHLDRVLVSDLRPGHILWLRLGRYPCHTAIVAEHPQGHGSTIVHAYKTAQKVVEHRLDQRWRSRIHGVFSYRGVNI